MNSRFARVMHRAHRAFGSAVALLVAVWCASGAVMTFSDYPRFSERERLAGEERLRRDDPIGVPPELRRWIAEGALSRGERARLSMLEGRATWIFDSTSGERRALLATAPWTSVAVDEDRAARVAESFFDAKARSVVRLTEPDQWTVGHWKPTTAPVFRVQLDDALDRQVYVAARTREIIQESTRRERLLAWLGAIPHWVYPAALRQSRDLWRVVVIALATFCLVASLSGLFVGVDVRRVLGRRANTPPRSSAIRDPILRWHHRLGLIFGAALSTWLFSGILSLSPFAWCCPPELSNFDRAQLHGQLQEVQELPISEIVARCEGALRDLRELELAALAGKLYAVCANQRGETRIIDTADATLSPQRALAAEAFAKLTPSGRADAKLEHAYDAYHYPTHRDPQPALPYLRVERGTNTLYLDPGRARLIAVHTQQSRITRWLYHGLHSFDVPGFYERRVMWRSALVTAMVIGTTVALLGLALLSRRWLRVFRHSRAR